MKAMLALTAALAVIAVAAPAALAHGQTQGYRFITDTLGGNGHPKQVPAQGYRFITDTLGGNGQPAARGYRFITDTLGGNGGASAAAPSATGNGFSWADAGVGAATAVGSILVLLGGALVAMRRRGRLAL